MNPLFVVTVAVGVFGGIAALVIAFIPYRKHRLALIDSLSTTIKTIEDRRMSKVAVDEDYPVHKELIDHLRPYRIFSGGFNRACDNYAALHAEICKQGPLSTYMVDPENYESDLGATQ